ncbi:MAG: WG repeat-containing protein [Bacteroidia bacterium]|nr:WG repeat-containing protein [Bacteroidia bacterium]
MISESNSTFFPFEGFLEKLRESGFPVGVHSYIQVQIILNQLGTEVSQETLKTVLAPLFAKNDRDQVRFYRMFDTYFSILEEVDQKTLGQVKPETEEDKKTKNRRRRHGDKSISANRWLFFSLSILVSAFFSYLIFAGYNAFMGSGQKTNIGRYLEKYELTADPSRYPSYIGLYMVNALLGRKQFCDDLENTGFSYQVLMKDGGAISVSFKNTSTDSLSHREWNFGNGQTLEDSVSPTIFYGDTGTYDVSLKIVNELGCTASMHQLVHISTPKTCQTSFEFNFPDPLNQQQIAFDDTSILDAGDEIVSWQWNMGDDNKTVVNGSDPQFSYPPTQQDYQEYRVCLDIETRKGCIDQFCKVVELHGTSSSRALLPLNTRPVVNFDLEVLRTSRIARFYPFIRLALALLLLFGLFFYELYRRNRRSLSLSREKSTEGPYSWPLVFPHEAELFTNEAIYRAATHLRQRQDSELMVLDMPQTIHATLNSGGFPSFRYSPGTRPSEYLVLIERSNYKDHQARFFWHLTEKLQSQDIYIDTYYYQSDFRMFWKEMDEKPLYLRELQVRHPGHRVIIFGDGEHLLDAVNGDLHQDAFEFLDWKDRAVLTPLAPADWGLQEIRLSAHFRVLPSTTQALAQLLTEFAADVPQRLGEWRRIVYSSTPDFETSITVSELEVYLGNDLFLWLSACAVYPELQWDLTLHLGKTLEKSGTVSEPLLSEQNLLKLIRIPWFRKGFMPDEIRMELIERLPDNVEFIAREEIIKVLDFNPPPKGTFAAEEYHKNLTIQRWKMNPGNLRERVKVEDQMEEMVEREEIEDVTILRELRTTNHSMMASMPVPDSWKKVLYREGMPLLGMRAWVRFAFVIPLVIFLLIPVIRFIAEGNVQTVKDLKQLVEKPDNIIEINGLYYKLDDAEDSARYFGFLGLQSFGNQDYGSAYNAFTEAIELDRLNPVYYYHRGLSNYQLTRNNKVDSLLQDSYNDFVRANSLIPLFTGTTQYEIDTVVLMPEIHTGIISHDGKQVIMASGSTVRIFQKDSLRLLKELNHPAVVKQINLSPDGQTLLTTNGNQASLWNLSSGEKIGDLIGHKHPVNAARISPNGQYIITGADDNLAIIWSRISLRPIRYLEYIHSGPIMDVSFSPDNRYVVTASSDSTAAIWNRNTGDFIQYLVGQEEPIISASFSPDSRLVMTASDNGSIFIWNLNGEAVEKKRIYGETLSQAIFSPDGSMLVTAGERNDHSTRIIRLFDYKNDQAILSIRVPEFRSEDFQIGNLSYSRQNYTLMMSVKGLGFASYQFSPQSFSNSKLKQYCQYNGTVLSYEREQFANSAQRFTELINLDSTDVDARYGRALSYFYLAAGAGTFDTAHVFPGLEDLQKIITQRPEYFDNRKDLLPLLFQIYSINKPGRDKIDQLCAFTDKVDPGSCSLLRYDEIQAYSEGLAAVRDGKFWGYINSRRKLVIPFNFLDPSPFINHLAVVKSLKHSRYVVIDTLGNIVFDNISTPSEGYCGVRDAQSRLWGFADEKTHLLVIPARYHSVENFYRGFAKVERQTYGRSLYGFIDKTGSEENFGGVRYQKITGNFKDESLLLAELPGGNVVQIQYQPSGNGAVVNETQPKNTDFQIENNPRQPFTLVGNLSNGLIRAVQDGKYGYVTPDIQQQVQTNAPKDPTYLVVINFQYESAFDFSFERAAVRRPGGKWGFIDIFGKAVIPFEYESVEYFTQKEEGKILALVTRQNQQYYIDRSGECMSYLKYGCPAPELRTQTTIKSESYVIASSGYVIFKEGEKWGIRTAEGKIITPAVYENQIVFSESRARVLRDGKWGFIDETGNVVVPLIFNGASDYSDGLAAVMRNGRWGYINMEGKIQIDFKFETPGQFLKGWTIVREGKISYKIDRLGNKIGDRKK